MPPRKPTAKATILAIAKPARARLPRAAKLKTATDIEAKHAEAVSVPKVKNAVKRKGEAKGKEKAKGKGKAKGKERGREKPPAAIPPRGTKKSTTKNTLKVIEKIPNRASCRKVVAEGEGSKRGNGSFLPGSTSTYRCRRGGRRKTANAGSSPGGAAITTPAAEEERGSVVPEPDEGLESESESESDPFANNSDFLSLLPTRHSLFADGSTSQLSSPSQSQWFNADINPLYANTIARAEDVLRLRTLVTKLGPGHPNVQRLFRNLSQWTGPGAPPTPGTYFVCTAPKARPPPRQSGDVFPRAENAPYHASWPSQPARRTRCGCGIERCTDGSICLLGSDYKPPGRATRLFSRAELALVIDCEVHNVHLDCPGCDLVIRHGLPLPLPFAMKTRCGCTSLQLAAKGYRADLSVGGGRKRKRRGREREALGEVEFERAVRDKILFLESEIVTDVEDATDATEREHARLR